jgi:DNA mismatch endonuclease Vsr
VKVRPDFVFQKIGLALFVDGCFWHGCPKHATQPKGTAAFWRRKFAQNIVRDQLVSRTLRSCGWQRSPDLGTHFAVGHQEAATRSAFNPADSKGIGMTAKYAKYAKRVLILFCSCVSHGSRLKASVFCIFVNVVNSTPHPSSLLERSGEDREFAGFSGFFARLRQPKILSKIACILFCI